jgi:pyruvate/2-oxoglutarate/acetoin dehydrogenase E1 component
MTYKDELVRAMNLLGSQEHVLFIGQNVRYGGTSMYHTFKQLPEERMIEVPVFEEIQMGISIGLALQGFLPVSIYPRMDFLILALNQIVNHLDKAEEMSDGQFKTKVIIRTAIGSTSPLMPGPQHCQDHTEALRLMCSNMHVVKLTRAEMVYPEYKHALEREQSTILVEIPGLYNKDLEHALKESRKTTSKAL